MVYRKRPKSSTKLKICKQYNLINRILKMILIPMEGTVIISSLGG